jgi:hypothetical protein
MHAHAVAQKAAAMESELTIYFASKRKLLARQVSGSIAGCLREVSKTRAVSTI